MKELRRHKRRAEALQEMGNIKITKKDILGLSLIGGLILLGICKLITGASLPANKVNS